MMLPFALALMTAAAIAALLMPLLRRRFDASRRVDHDVAIYRDQLAEVERDRASGALDEARADAAKAEIERRLLAAADADAREAPIEVAPRRFLPTAVAILVPLVALGVYFQIGHPELPGQPFAERKIPATPAGPGAEPAIMKTVRDLRERVTRDPKDADAWLALGRLQLQVGRSADAAESFRQGRAAAPARADIVSALGEALVFEADGVVTPAAKETFTAALGIDPKTAGARYYLGLGEAQAGDSRAALTRWLALEAESPDDAPWLATLLREIDRVAKQSGIDPKSIRPDRKTRTPRDPGMPQPGEDDVKRMEKLSPQERDATIRGMVDGLAERLKSTPDDVEGWRRLARARAVLGEHAQAAEAYARADKLKPDDPATLSAWVESRLRLDQSGTKLTPETIALLRRLEAASPDSGLALFFLAQVAEEAGDKPGAIARLRRLQAMMPEGTPTRGAIDKRLRALEGK